MSAFIDLLRIYQRAGFQVRTGLNSYHCNNHRDAPFTVLFKGDQQIHTGGGVAPEEIYFYENLFAVYRPQRLFVVGNAFGWSTLLFALLNPKAQVVAIDNGDDGDAVAWIDLTNRIALKERLPAKVVFATSPQDVGGVVADHLGGPVDFAFIDGMHTNEQQEKDYDAIAQHAAKECVFTFHDVMLWNMVPSFQRIAAKSGWPSRVLLRTPSGIGVVSAPQLEPQIGECLDAFCERNVRAPITPTSVG